MINENEIKITAPQDTPERNKQVIAWANRQGQIDRDRYLSTEPPRVVKPVEEKPHPHRFHLWRIGRQG